MFDIYNVYGYCPCTMKTNIIEKLVSLVGNTELASKLKEKEEIANQLQGLQKRNDALDHQIGRMLPTNVKTLLGEKENPHRKHRADRETVTNRVTELLKKNPLTVRELAAKADASIATIGNILDEELANKVNKKGNRPVVYSFRN